MSIEGLLPPNADKAGVAIDVSKELGVDFLRLSLNDVCGRLLKSAEAVMRGGQMVLPCISAGMRDDRVVTVPLTVFYATVGAEKTGPTVRAWLGEMKAIRYALVGHASMVEHPKDSDVPAETIDALEEAAKKADGEALVAAYGKLSAKPQKSITALCEDLGGDAAFRAMTLRFNAKGKFLRGIPVVEKPNSPIRYSGPFSGLLRGSLVVN